MSASGGLVVTQAHAMLQVFFADTYVGVHFFAATIFLASMLDFLLSKVAVDVVKYHSSAHLQTPIGARDSHRSTFHSTYAASAINTTSTSSPQEYEDAQSSLLR